MKTPILPKASLILPCLLTTAFALEMPRVFSDHMVLQQGQPLPVWGKAEPGSNITVSFGKQSVKTTADAQGAFRAELAAVPASATPAEMTVSSGAKTLTFTDVLVGEVWLCSGQSNMQWDVKGALDGDIETLSAGPSHIRLLNVERITATEPRFSSDAVWTISDPQSIARFSAVAYHFGSSLEAALDVPVGLIHSSWGGTPAIAWTRPQAFDRHPLLQARSAEWEKGLAERPRLMAEWEKKLTNWKKDRGIPQETKISKKTHPDAPQPPNLPFEPGSPHRPGVLANGMLAPIAPYALRGAIWYQGESDAAWEPSRYHERLEVMFSDWREWWGNPELAVGIVQLASFMPAKTGPSDDPWPNLRESQRQYTLRDPRSGLAVAIDAGEADDIHPYDKHIIGRRLARWALAKVYGKNIPAGGPIPQKAEFGAQVNITFDQPGSGLRALNGSPLGGFTVAGEDGVFHPAAARIEGKNRVIVSSPAVTAPRHVRYAWQNNPVDANLVSKERLPAVPFELRSPAAE